jgi:hypothetical protein
LVKERYMTFINCGCCGAEIYVNIDKKTGEISYTELISNGHKNCEEEN